MPIRTGKQLLAKAGFQMIGLGVYQGVRESLAFIRTFTRKIKDNIAVITFEFIQDRLKRMAFPIATQCYIVRTICAKEQEVQRTAVSPLKIVKYKNERAVFG